MSHFDTATVFFTFINTVTLKSDNWLQLLDESEFKSNDMGTLSLIHFNQIHIYLFKNLICKKWILKQNIYLHGNKKNSQCKIINVL